MFEVYYAAPANPCKEAALTARVTSLGGRLTFREVPAEGALGAVCLTYEFEDLARATETAAALRAQGEHVEGPVDYGNGDSGTL